MLFFKRSLLVFFVLAPGICPNIFAAQFSAEKRLTDQLMKSIKVGETVILKSNEREFPGIYTAATTPKSRGGVILLHDLGAHANWPELIMPLRTELPRAGWNTLSLQLPVLSDHPDLREFTLMMTNAQTRITAAIKYFGEQGIFNIALIGYGVGGAIGLNYLLNAPKNNKVIAFAGLATYDHALSGHKMLTVQAIEEIKIPLLDIVGSLDSLEVTASAKARQLKAAKVMNKNYRLLILAGGDHFFSGLEQKLLKRIRAWLKKQAPSMELGAKGVVPDGKKTNNTLR